MDRRRSSPQGSVRESTLVLHARRTDHLVRRGHPISPGTSIRDRHSVETRLRPSMADGRALESCPHGHSYWPPAGSSKWPLTYRNRFHPSSRRWASSTVDCKPRKSHWSRAAAVGANSDCRLPRTRDRRTRRRNRRCARGDRPFTRAAGSADLGSRHGQDRRARGGVGFDTRTGGRCSTVGGTVPNSSQVFHIRHNRAIIVT